MLCCFLTNYYICVVICDCILNASFHLFFSEPSKVGGGWCQYWDAGYSALIEWDKPDGKWTEVQIKVNGKTHDVSADEDRQKEISGLLPARTYEVSVVSISGDQTSEPYVFQCETDPTGE